MSHAWVSRCTMYFYGTRSLLSFLFRPSFKYLLIVFLLGAGISGARAQVPADSTNAQQAAAVSETVTLPAGTSIALALTHPVQSRRMRRGDDVYAQITSPVTLGEMVVIPPGTYIQGKFEKARQKEGRAELQLQPVSITFPNGYVASISGPVLLRTLDGYAYKDASAGRTTAAMLLPVAGLGLGALIGHAAGGSDGTAFPAVCPPGSVCMPTFHDDSRLKNTAIGSVIGGAAGGIGSVVLLLKSHDFVLDVGTPVQMVLEQPIELKKDRVLDAVSKANEHPVQPPQPRSSQLGRSPFDCPGTEQWCGGRCMGTLSLMNDSSNCGRCGNSCSFGETCSGGSCGCGPGSSRCMGSCVSSGTFFSDSNNCGRCGNSCGIGETCMGGSCHKL